MLRGGWDSNPRVLANKGLAQRGPGSTQAYPSPCQAWLPPLEQKPSLPGLKTVHASPGCVGFLFMEARQRGGR